MATATYMAVAVHTAAVVYTAAAVYAVAVVYTAAAVDAAAAVYTAMMNAIVYARLVRLGGSYSPLVD